MAINAEYHTENEGRRDLEKPFIRNQKCVDREEETVNRGLENGSIWMVLLSTSVAVCGSFEFGSCYAMFGSIITIGAMIGAISSGRIADFIGRKGAMRISAALCIIGWLAVYFAMVRAINGALWLDIGRFCTGYGIGIFSYVVPVFIAEITPKNLRGGLATVNQLMIVSGSSMAFLLGAVVTWRTLALTGLIPCILQLVGLCFIPESPRWLAKVGHQNEFELSLRMLRGKYADVSKEAAEIQKSIGALQDLPKVQIMDLFHAKYMRPVIIGAGLMFFQQFGGINGIGFYASETLVAAGFSSGTIGTISYAIIQVPITLLGAILMDRSGRRPLLMISASGTFIGCLLAAASFYLKGQSLLLGWVPGLAISGVLVYVASFSIGMGAVPWVIMSEIFPIHVKGIAGSLVVLVNWSGAWAVSYTFNFLMSWSPPGNHKNGTYFTRAITTCIGSQIKYFQIPRDFSEVASFMAPSSFLHHSLTSKDFKDSTMLYFLRNFWHTSISGTFSVYAGFCALAVLFVAKIVPETKGRTLEEIQASISS
ncbi:sugar transporter ERD6-like 16 isoform X4 [Primulina eburnea]|uniref:sugar transporter ERD6-like 16 isoform X4 n=1 Tax=Primulina eburnea TaxID=1245227 RepID=UPI003C6CA225